MTVAEGRLRAPQDATTATSTGLNEGLLPRGNVAFVREASSRGVLIGVGKLIAFPLEDCASLQEARRAMQRTFSRVMGAPTFPERVSQADSFETPDACYAVIPFIRDVVKISPNGLTIEQFPNWESAGNVGVAEPVKVAHFDSPIFEHLGLDLEAPDLRGSQLSPQASEYIYRFLVGQLESVVPAAEVQETPHPTGFHLGRFRIGGRD